MTKSCIWQGICAALLLGIAGAQPAMAQAGGTTAGTTISNNTPRFASTGQNLGPAAASQTIQVSLALSPHNRAEMDALAATLYNPNSSQYHEWLQPSDIVSRFAPTASDVQTVEKFLNAQGLSVVSVGPNNFSVRAEGTIAQIQKAFSVKINNFRVNGQTYYANTSDPILPGAAGALVQAIYGLSTQQYAHPLNSQTVPKKPTSGLQTANSGSPANGFSNTCFGGPKVESFTTGGTYPTATYAGNLYNPTGDISGCGYTPPEIHAAYNLNGLYSAGHDGSGQTITIIDWCGSPTIQSDANAFSAAYGLPALTSANFHIYYSSTTPTCGGPDVEINIDVEWAHAIAPGAHIALVVPPTSSFMDVDDAELYALANGLGHVISGSYGSEELYTPLSVLNEENLINEIAAMMGVSANFATGDSGDYTFDDPSVSPPSVIAPADSPWATAVGGTTLALTSKNAIAWQAGWGNNETLLIDEDSIFDPPLNFGFYAGSGGGASAVFSKPSFQKKLAGTQRLLPDIAWLADPFTGAVIAITESFVSPPLEWQVWGGTSLATPMFSGLWAIANQEAGVPLGQAAALLYSMPAGTITDIVPLGSAHNVTATITTAPSVSQSFSAAEIAAPLEGNTTFISAMWNIPLETDTTYVLTFETDSGLVTNPGWDDVTGLGVPNGKAFADYFASWKP